MRRTLARTLWPLVATFAVWLYAPSTAGAQRLVGDWEVTYEREAAMARHGSTPTVAQPSMARMTLRQRGDSIFGEWQPVVAAGVPTPPVQELRGIQRGDSAFIELLPVVDPEASLISNVANDVMEFLRTHVHGMPPMHVVLEFQLRNDVMAGIRRSVSADGAVKTTGRPMSGVRVKR
jgi:hypothetical protein